jgi:hypothetical protein
MYQTIKEKDLADIRSDINQQKKAREDKATQVKEVPGWEYYYTAPCPDMFKNLKK